MSPKWIAAIGALLLVAGCDEEAAPPAPVRPVLTMTIVPVAMEMFGPFASVVEARYQTQLGFQLSGRMVARDVYIGDIVRKGQRLAALDPTVTQFALSRAKADLADSRAQLMNAQGIEERQRTLATGGNTSQATLDNAVAGLATAKARLDQTQASLRVAEDQMGYTELHANFDGVITAWTAEVGQYVTNGQAVVTVARPDVREAVVDIADDLMINVRPGMTFAVRLLVAPTVMTTAVVREIGPLADAATRSHRVPLDAAGCDRRLPYRHHHHGGRRAACRTANLRASHGRARRGRRAFRLASHRRRDARPAPRGHGVQHQRATRCVSKRGSRLATRW